MVVAYNFSLKRVVIMDDKSYPQNERRGGTEKSKAGTGRSN